MRLVLLLVLAWSCAFGKDKAADELLAEGKQELAKRQDERAYDNLKRAVALFEADSGAKPAAYGDALDCLGLAQLGVRNRQLPGVAQAEALVFFQSAADFYDHQPDADPLLHAQALDVLRVLSVQMGHSVDTGDLIDRASKLRFGEPANRHPGPKAPKVEGVSKPKLIKKVQPKYTDAARLLRFEGTVAIAATVNTDGTAANFHILHYLGLGLDEQAIDALQQWRFEPATKDGQPVAFVATFEINFRLR